MDAIGVVSILIGLVCGNLFVAALETGNYMAAVIIAGLFVAWMSLMLFDVRRLGRMMAR